MKREQEGRMVDRSTGVGRRRLWMCALAAASALVPAPAKADSPAAANPETHAEALFRAGSQAFDLGNVAEACEDFTESLRLTSTLGTLLNLALCHEREGQNASAWLEFTHAAAWARDPSARDRHEFARQHASALERLLYRVDLSIDPQDGPIALQLDGASVDGSRPLPMFVDPGTHIVRATAPSRKAYESTFTVARDASATAVRIPTLAGGSWSPFAGPPSRAIGLFIGSAGIVAMAVAGGFGVDALGKMNSLGARCRGACDPSPAITDETISLAAFGGGALALALGGWFFLAPSQTMQVSRATNSNTRLVPMLNMTTAGISAITTLR